MSSVCLKSMINYYIYTSTRGHRYEMFIARTHKLIFSFFSIDCVAPMWNILPNT